MNDEFNKDVYRNLIYETMYGDRDNIIYSTMKYKPGYPVEYFDILYHSVTNMGFFDSLCFVELLTILQALD